MAEWSGNQVGGSSAYRTSTYQDDGPSSPSGGPPPIPAADPYDKPIERKGRGGAAAQTVNLPPGSPIPAEKPEWRVTLDNWMVNEGPKIIFVIIWAAVQAALFFQAFVQFEFNAGYANLRAVLGNALPVARGSAAVLNFNCGIILFSVCRNIITFLRTTIIGRLVPLDKNITFHKAIAWTILLFTVVHVGCHYFNMLFIDQSHPSILQAALLPPTATSQTVAFTTVAGSTGHILIVIMLIMYSAAMENIRRKYFEMFWYTHHLFILFFVFLLSHGAGCLLQSSTYPIPPNPCVPNFWKWFVAGGACYLLERLWREIRSRRKTYVSKVVQHPSKVVEVQMKKPSMKYKPGQYLFLNCPDISMLEWHPFTISSAPEEDFVSCHIRVVGDWTTAFAKRLGCIIDKNDERAPMTTPSELPRVRIDGPFGSASEDVFKYEIAVCIGAGIGVTPFSSILKAIWYRVINPSTVMKLRKVYFIWICRDTEAFEWFGDLLEALEAEDIDQFLSINVYLTGNLKNDQVRNILLNDSAGQDALTGLRSPTKYGRPNFDQMFHQMTLDHSGTDIGIFFCGPKVLSTTLHKAANRHTSSRIGGTKFYYHKENF